MSKRRIHDGIVGVLVAAGVLLGYFADPLWLWLPGLLGLVLFQSAFSGFCPLYYVLDKACPDKNQ
jgi:hypothetical protein